MPISKIKNIVILILLVANIMLLVLLIPLARQRQKQQAQAQHNLAHRFFVAAPDEHIEDDADNCQNGTQKRGLEEEHQYIV